MKRLTLAAVAVLALAGTLTATAVPESRTQSSHQRICSVEDFDIWAGKVWDQARWRRGMPKNATIAAQRRWLECAVTSKARRSMQGFWREVKRDYFSARAVRRWRAKYRSFEYPDGSHWAVPYPIAWCESGGNYYVGPSGAYGLIPPFPQYLPPKRQDEIAFNLYREMGEAPWAPYEAGCAYR